MDLDNQETRSPYMSSYPAGVITRLTGSSLGHAQALVLLQQCRQALVKTVCSTLLIKRLAGARG